LVLCKAEDNLGFPGLLERGWVKPLTVSRDTGDGDRGRARARMQEADPLFLRLLSKNCARPSDG
jgi:hypothetical protein